MKIEISRRTRNVPLEQETVSCCAMQHLQRPAERDPVHRKLAIVASEWS